VLPFLERGRRAMKKVVLIAAGVLTLASTGYAKTIEAGRLELSGTSSAMYASQSIDMEGFPDVDVSATSLALEGNYYPFRNFGIGALLSYMKADLEVSSEDLKVSMGLIGPQLKYNLSLSERVSCFAVGSVGYIKSEVEVLQLINEDADGWYWNLGGGIKFFALENVSLDAVLRYQDASLEGKMVDNIDISGYLFGAGLSVFFNTGRGK
jgi:hypothetical protein